MNHLAMPLSRHHTIIWMIASFLPSFIVAHWIDSKGLSAGVQSKLDPCRQRTKKTFLYCGQRSSLLLDLSAEAVCKGPVY